MPTGYTRAEKVAEGKTKRIWAVAGHPDLVIVESKNDITAHDDPKLTRQFGTKAQLATATTCRVFELLQACGIPTTYIWQLSPTEFLAHRSQMVQLEIVGRRFAVGSYLKRFPHLTPVDPTQPHRFRELRFELFLKTTGCVWEGQKIACDDPWIVNPYAIDWELAHPKPKSEAERATAFPRVHSQRVMGDCKLGVEGIEHVLLRPLFLVLEKAWAMLGLTFIDIKIEIDTEGRVSDVLDSDAWRLWFNGRALDKQVFRDLGEAGLDECAENYEFVAGLASRLKLPRQALVLWRASPKDDWPTMPCEQIPGVEVVRVTGSGHKQTIPCLDQLGALVTDFPQGGVIVDLVGRSNGLGPTLSAHSPWPIISCPTTYASFPHDIHSSVRCPSDTPHLTAWPDSNAIQAALNILSNTNPAVYAFLQQPREQLNNTPLLDDDGK